MNEAKSKLKEMQNDYREQDKNMRDDHEMVTIMEEKSRKLKELITDRKNNGNGPKKLTDQDVEKVDGNIKELKTEYRKVEKDV